MAEAHICIAKGFFHNLECGHVLTGLTPGLLAAQTEASEESSGVTYPSLPDGVEVHAIVRWCGSSEYWVTVKQALLDTGTNFTSFHCVGNDESEQKAVAAVLNSTAPLNRTLIIASLPTRTNGSNYVPLLEGGATMFWIEAAPNITAIGLDPELTRSYLFRPSTKVSIARSDLRGSLPACHQSIIRERERERERERDRERETEREREREREQILQLNKVLATCTPLAFGSMELPTSPGSFAGGRRRSTPRTLCCSPGVMTLRIIFPSAPRCSKPQWSKLAATRATNLSVSCPQTGPRRPLRLRWQSSLPSSPASRPSWR